MILYIVIISGHQYDDPMPSSKTVLLLCSLVSPSVVLASLETLGLWLLCHLENVNLFTAEAHPDVKSMKVTLLHVMNCLFLSYL